MFGSYLAETHSCWGPMDGQLLCLNQKHNWAKPTHRCEIKILKVQEAAVALEIIFMLSKETTEIGPGTNIPLIIPIKNGESHLSMNLKMLNYFITCTKLKITTLKQIRETTHPG